jgi:tetratricopeptide (TPR) repeat protein
MDEASEEVRQLAALAAARPGDPVARAHLAAALEGPQALRLAGEALTLARRCLELGIVEPAAEAAEVLAARFGAEAETSLELGLLVADCALQRRDVERTRQLLEAVVAEHPDALGARLRIAALALGVGEAESARRWIEPVARANAQTCGLYVQALLALGRADEAALEARAGIGGGFADASPANDVEDGLADAPSAGPEPAEPATASSLLHQLLGIAELTRGRVEAAIAALSEGLRLAPEDPVAYYNLALAFEASGSRSAALGVADAGLELAPQDARLLALKARLAAPP